jgi:hypothetical protein
MSETGNGPKTKKRSPRGGAKGMQIASAFLDRRVKLLPCQRERIHQMYHNEGVGIRHLSRVFNVNKRLIQFICFPERQKKNLELREDRGGSSQYYDRLKHRESMADHRSYKRQIFERRKM